jgi:hypothetical protein
LFKKRKKESESEKKSDFFFVGEMENGIDWHELSGNFIFSTRLCIWLFINIKSILWRQEKYCNIVCIPHNVLLLRLKGEFHISKDNNKLKEKCLH